MPDELDLKYDREDCTLRQTPATWVTWGQLFCKCGGEIKSNGRGLTLNGMMEHQCTACGEKRWLAETFPRLMYEEAPKQG